jgi:23S rRNA (adenine2503-C2)-methyltransferase
MTYKSLCGLTAGDLFSMIGPMGFTHSHAVSISSSIYRKRNDEISLIKKIPKKLKDELIAKTSSGVLRPVASQDSVDKTIKYLFRTDTGKEFETVFIPDKKRNTVCVSTQSGCRMGCRICVTGSYGFRSNLTAGEIVNQIISIPDAGKVTHVVFMGMGEPLDNLGNVLKACEIITSEWGLAISPKNVTVSTVGITKGITKFLDSTECNLTFSLHSPFSEERKLYVPAEKQHPAHKIIEIMKNYPVRKKRRLSLAYVMIKDINDSDIHLEGLKTLVKGTKVRINLLPYHIVGEDLNAPSSHDRMQFFKHNLIINGISASVRRSRGIDISAACGLLASGLE